MAGITKYKLAEQVRKLWVGGSPATAVNLSMTEIYEGINQIVNAMLKAEHFTVNGQMGETIPNGSIITEYRLRVENCGINKSRVMLPAMPVKLPRNMGIFQVMGEDTEGFPDPNQVFIPCQMGEGNMLRSQRPILSDLGGQGSYEPRGIQLTFNKDLTASGSDPVYVYVNLVLMDISAYTEYEALPILPEMEDEIIMRLLQRFGKEVVPDKLVDAATKEQKGTPIRNQQQN
jgi:hypothetical protein